MKYFLILFVIVIVGCSNVIEPSDLNYPKFYGSNFVFDTEILSLNGVKVFYDWGMVDENEIYIYDRGWNTSGIENIRPIGVDSIIIHLYWMNKHPRKKVVFWMMGSSNIVPIEENEHHITSTIKQNWKMYDLDFAIMFPDTIKGTFRVVGELFLTKK